MNKLTLFAAVLLVSLTGFPFARPAQTKAPAAESTAIWPLLGMSDMGGSPQFTAPCTINTGFVYIRPEHWGKSSGLYLLLDGYNLDYNVNSKPVAPLNRRNPLYIYYCLLDKNPVMPQPFSCARSYYKTGSVG